MLRTIRNGRRWFASLLALACVVMWGTNPVAAQVQLLGGGSFSGGALTAATTLADDVLLTFGTAGDTTRPAIAFVTANTPDTGMLLVGSVSDSWIIAENADKAFDFAHALQTDPTLFIHSHNQTTTEFMALFNNGANGVINANGSNTALLVQSAGTNKYLLSSAEFRAGSTLGIGFSANSDPNASQDDAFFKRKNAAIIQMGSDVNGALTSQQFTGPNGITGTDVAGGILALGGQVGTGAGAGAQTSINRALMGATGTSAQTNTQGVVACESKTLSNTTATATALANVTLPSNSAGAVRVTVSVLCNDGTNFDADVVTSYVGYVNKATVVTVGTPVTTGTAAANNSGSCTVAPTFVANSNSIDIKVTPVITTIVPTTTTGFINVENLGSGVVSCK